VVYGTVKGNLRAKTRIEIKKDGSVNGDLTTARIMIEDARTSKVPSKSTIRRERVRGSAAAYFRVRLRARGVGPKTI